MPSLPPTPSRRDFLRETSIALAMLATTGATASGVAWAAEPTDAYAPAFFTPVEWTFVNALVDRLIPADPEGPGAINLGVPEFIDRQMNEPYGHGSLWYMKGPFRIAPATLGYQLEFPPRDIYRIGIAAAEQAIEKSFGKRLIDLSVADRDQALKHLEDGSLKIAPVPGDILFHQFLINTQEGYFSDPVHGGNKDMGSWKMIGFPGARADYTDWVDRYGAKYPFGPVSIKDLGA